MKPREVWAGIVVALAAVLAGCSGGVGGTAQAVGAQAVGSAAPSPVAPVAGLPGASATGGNPGAATPGPETSQSPAVGGTATAQDTSWLKPGYRLTYQVGAVSSAADRSSWKEDPAGPYVDSSTGKRYSSDRGLAPASQAAQGARSLDFISADQTAVVVATSDLLYDGGTQTWSPVPNTDRIGPAQGKPGELWIAPATLVRYSGSGTGGGDQVLNGPMEFNGQQVPTVVFVNNNPNNYYFYAYDAGTGILLRADTSVVYEGTSSPTSPNATNTRTSLELKSARQRTLPGVGAALPSWAAQGATLSYAGQIQLIDPSSGQPYQGSSVGVNQQVSIMPGGASWGTFQVQQQTQGAAGVETAVGNVTSASTFVMDPASLATMQAGQVLDEDPAIGEKWTVQQVADGRVTVAVQLSGRDWVGAYETTTGRLLHSRLVTRSQVLEFQLQG